MDFKIVSTINAPENTNVTVTNTVKTIAGYIGIYWSADLNLSITSGKFSCILKLFYITPIFKKEDPLNVVNYRSNPY